MLKLSGVGSVPGIVPVRTPGELFVYALLLSGPRAGGFWPEQVGKSYLFGKILPARAYA